ncbi:MAG: hypothetical protein QM702_25160 [Rubrivivax sp.]
MLSLINDRRRLIRSHRRARKGIGKINSALKAAALSWRALAEKFEVSIRLVRLIACDQRRQTVWREE